MLLTCKCLNVSITIDGSKIENVDFEKLGSASSDLQDAFFKEGAGSVELIEISKEQPSLVHMRTVGEWLVHRCLICDCMTHAIHRERRSEVLVSRHLLSDADKIAALKSSEVFSDVFHVVTNRLDDPVPETPPNSISGSGAVQVAALALQQSLAEALRNRTAQVEELVRAFTEQKYSELEMYRKTAHEDHQALLRVLHEKAELLKEPEIQPKQEVAQKDKKTKAPPNLPPAPLPTLRAAPPKSAPALRNRRPFNTNGTAAVIPQRQKVRNVGGKNLAGLGQPQGSMDSEGLFDLEGMEEEAAQERFNSGEDTEEDTDESGSHDEGIHIPRSRGSAGSAAAMQLAKSLPVNVPAFHLATAGAYDSTGDPFAPQRNQLVADLPREQGDSRMDIAASIKALAQSVRGGASVFGDLPRPPRFSTQL